MALAVLLASLLVGALFTLPIGGRDFVISAVDVAAVGIGVWGLVVARRRGTLRLDVALLGYLGMFAVVLVQLIVGDDRLDLLGGASRFAGPFLLFVGMSQLLGDEDRLRPGHLGRPNAAWRWPELFAVFGGLLALWIGALLIGGLSDPVNETFYDVKNSISMPLGASNYVAAFVLVPAVALFALGLHRRRYLLMTIMPAAGVVATLSRGAFLGLGAGLAVAAVTRLRARAGAILAAVIAGIVLAVSAVMGVVGTAIPVTASTIAGRLVLLEAAWDGFVAHPVVGVGLNSILDVTGSLPEPHVNAHNLLLHALVTTGLLGTMAYLALWWFLARRTTRSILAGDAEATALMAAAVALFVHAAAEALAYTRAVEALLAAMLAIAATRPQAGAVRERPWGPGSPTGSSIAASPSQAAQR